VYSLSYRYEALEMFKRFVAEVETKLEDRVKTLRTYRGHEYLLHVFNSIVRKTVCEDNLRFLAHYNETVWQSIRTEYCLTWAGK